MPLEKLEMTVQYKRQTMAVIGAAIVDEVAEEDGIWEEEEIMEEEHKTLASDKKEPLLVLSVHFEFLIDISNM